METDKIEDAKVLDRLQDYNDEAGETVRGQEISAAGSHHRDFVFQIKVRRLHFLGVTIN